MVYHKLGSTHARTSHCKGWVFFFVFVCTTGLNSLTIRAQNAYDEALWNVLNNNTISTKQVAELKRSNFTIVQGIYLEHYNDFLNLIAFSKPIDESTFPLVTQSHIEQIEKLNKTFQYSNYLSEMNLHLAFIHAINGDYLKSARLMWQAHQDFENIQKTQGYDRLQYAKLEALFDVLIGAIPDEQQWIANVLSLKGDASKGMAQLDKLRLDVSTPSGSKLEIFLIEKLLCLYFEEANVVSKVADSWCASPLSLYLDGTLFLRKKCCFDDSKIDDDQIDKFPLLGYLKGRMLLNSLNDSCIWYFDAFDKSYSGKSFKADILLRRAWHARISSNSTVIPSLKERLADLKDYPTAIDRQAKSEIEKVESYPLALLKARLLFDGGYFEQARNELLGYKVDSLNLCEFYYRKGRISHELKNIAEALSFYQKCIDNNTNPQRYFAANAALLMAELLIFTGSYEEAKERLDICDKLNINEYKGDIKNNAAKLRHQISLKMNQ